MALALTLVILFALYTLMMGVCISRVVSLTRELDQMRALIATLGQVQHDMSGDGVYVG